MAKPEQDGNPLGELLGQRGRRGDVHDIDGDTKPGGVTPHQPQTVVAEGTATLCHKEHGAAVDRGHAATIVCAMRPATAAVVLGLLVIILGTFLLKAQTSGFTP